ncbi:MaoC family dehydratase N-terminal domain-containing protein [Alkalihalophilus marmarensis]|uniref:MaoC/PaaZ C-terminal domain-containing protein n=1 Tax=Alkalihalophilus marmarensis TaxID=521377 RepID=UPI00203DBBDB|nr:MaoC/PaaZ C-terminal domain-containing protein [Alkalihalophilus marmarensis]MCM3491609.1 MaoC family dehydratase N-terminal domain-containing protein [Alkalihalophilus marmarensis]
MNHKTMRMGPIEPIDLVKYAGASGDFNPIHTVPECAKNQGHRDIIAHGMYVMGLAARSIEEWFPHQKVRRIQVRFMSPTYPNDQLIIQAKCTESATGGWREGLIEITDEREEIKLKGLFALHEEE